MKGSFLKNINESTSPKLFGYIEGNQSFDIMFLPTPNLVELIWALVILRVETNLPNFLKQMLNPLLSNINYGNVFNCYFLVKIKQRSF